MNHNAELSFGDTVNDYSTYYINRNGKWDVYEGGFYYPRKKLNGLNLNNYTRVVLKPGETVLVYNRIHEFITGSLGFQNKIKVQFNFTNPILLSQYIQDESIYEAGVHDSILLGILLLACFFNLFIFFTVRERVYLYFSLYALFMGVGRTWNEAYFVFLREHRVLWFWIYYLIVWNFTFFLRTIFIQSFLRIRDHAPQWNRLLTWFNFITLAFACLGVLFFYTIYTMEIPIASISFAVFRLLFDLLPMTLTFLVLISFLILWKDKSPERSLKALVFPLMSLWWIGDSITVLYRDYGFIAFSASFTVWENNSWFLIETFCLGLLVLTFSWLLLLRFRQLQGKIATDALEREKEKNQLIEQKRIELEKTVEERTAELKLSLDHLRSTQAQLIQQEKMASLGELTAGIAHEIQNPLNFVNNFSEVNAELLSEIKEQIQQGNFNEVQKIVNNISDNERKVIHHGKRADSIVKNMLQHSRSTSGEKELTDINALADEYLRLSYYGFRAKDKAFHAAIKTDFDKNIGQINLVQQDIGRVFLNLFNNAFYAVTEKKIKSGDGYEPLVSVSSKKANGIVEIKVDDNGGGISQKVLDKIFQPFFTTKPAGQGTGLGLSLSYDIIKAHGGEIKVETKDGDGSSFIVQLKI
jgi:signal transduction histidine kinase